MKQTFLSYLMAFVVAVLAMPANAAGPDAGLYDPLPPEGSAFVRYINASADTASKAVGANGKASEYAKPGDVTPYFVVPQGKAEIGFGDIKLSQDVVSGKFYTVVWTGGEAVQVIEDPVNDNRAKSQILFYNLASDEAATLKTADGKVEVVGATEKGKSGVRQINPVKVTLAVYKGDAKIADVGEESLERGMAYSAVLVSPTKVVWARGITNTTR
ncbi:MAG: alginate O-acetyltransferase AlgF [Alphaproteobacteria bacterium]|nr:alginate O-acetyltransferase AlgF [Alphaproteobacteria bacterium]